MLKKHMAACLVATMFAAAPALAQTSTTNPSGGTDRPAATGSGSTATGSSAMQPGAAGSSSGSSSVNSSSMNQGAAQGQFMTQMQPGQIMASKLIGTRVVSTNNESIGDINDVIVDRNGQAVAAVVGVGGFLGIGEKDVAIPFNSLEFASSQQANAMGNNSGGNAGNNVSTTGSTATGTTGSTAAGGAMSGNTGTAGTNNASANSDDNDGPDRVVLRMTKAELQAAPAFNTDRNANASTSGSGGSTGSGASGSGAGGTTAPRQ